MMIKVLSVAFRKMKKKKCKTSKCFRAQEKRVNAVTLIEDFCHFVCFSRHIFLPLSQELQDMSAFFKYFWFFFRKSNWILHKQTSRTFLLQIVIIAKRVNYERILDVHFAG